MSWSLVIGSMLLVAIIAISLWLRAVNIRRRLVSRDIQQETFPSVLSKALAQLIGVAGGIYLSLVAMFSFLRIQIPPEMHLFGVEMEPLAFVSIVIALVQPFFVRLWSGLGQLRQS